MENKRMPSDFNFRIVRGGDLETLAEASEHSNLRYHQLEPGRFDGALTEVRFGNPGPAINQSRGRTGSLVMVRRRHLSHATLLCGPPPDGSIGFGIPDPKTKTSVDGDVAGPKTICHVAAHREIDLFTSGDFISIAVDQDLLLEALREQGVDTSALIERFTTELPRDAIARLQRCARDILSAFEVEPDLIGRPSVRLTMRKQLVAALVESLVEGWVRPSRSTLPARVQAVRRARDYAMAHSRAPITVVDLSKVAGVSPRTLRNGFHEQFGVGPKAYLTALRLSSARRSLREAAPSSTTVTEVALENGFWHLGRFAQAYRRHFGELPTTTLNRPPR